MGRKLFFCIAVIFCQIIFTGYFWPNVILLAIYLVSNTLWNIERLFLGTIFLNFSTIIISNLLIRQINLDSHGESLWFAINLLTLVIANLLMILMSWQNKNVFWKSLFIIGILTTLIILVDIRLVMEK